jgi:hypothetical protein
MYQKEKNEVIKAGITLDRYELIALSGGNISMRIGDQVLVTPSGMIYEDMLKTMFLWLILMAMLLREIENLQLTQVLCCTFLGQMNQLKRLSILINLMLQRRSCCRRTSM